MTEYLHDVTFDRVDRVYSPANPLSRIVLAKSAKVTKGSTDELHSEARAALTARFGDDVWMRDLRWNGTDTKSGSMVYESNNDLMSVTYVIDDSGDMTLAGDPIEVRAAFVPVTKGNTSMPTPNVLDLNDAEATTKFLEGMMALREPDEPTELTDEAVTAAISGWSDEQLSAAGITKSQTSDPETDSVEKLVKSGAITAEVAERIRKSEETNAENTKRIAKMESDTRLASFRKSAADEMGDLNENADNLGQLLAEVADVVGDDHEIVKSLTRVLKAASAQVAEGADLLTKEAGKGGERVFSKATQELDALATEMAAAEGTTFHQAKTKVAESNPDLVSRHYAGE